MKKYTKILLLLCTIVYFISYLTRINYSAVLIEIVNSRGITKAAASLAITASSVSYGTGQLVSGYFGDKIKPHKIILAGFICTTAMNFLLPLFNSVASSVVIWTVNGFAQAMMWPPIVKILTSKTKGEEYQKACVFVSWGSSFATIFVYLVSPVIIHTFGWKAVFVLSASAGLIMSIVWAAAYPKISGKIQDVTPENIGDDQSGGKMNLTIGILLAAIMIIIVAQGALRDGISTWMPTYISETFNLGSEISILTGVILPIFSIVCFQFSSFMNRRLIKNEFLNAGIMFSAAVIFSLILSFFGGKNAILAVASLAIVNGCMHGINYLLICLTPQYFVKYGKVSFISGLLNSCTYVGSAVSTYGIALMTNNQSWNFIALSWGMISLFGAIVCLAIVPAWIKFSKGGILKRTK